MNHKTKTFDYTERHLQCVWADPLYRPAILVTNDGREVTVESPGRWNLEAGPDFIDAVIKAGNMRITGDVEIHIHPADWLRHNHSKDPRYAKVALHVSYFNDSIPPPDMPENVLQISLVNGLNSLPGFSFDDIDVIAYPHSAHNRVNPPCSTALLKCDSDWIMNMLETAGMERIYTKASKISKSIAENGRMQSLYTEIMTALGYKNNKRNFRRLAGLVPVSELLLTKDNTEAYAILMGAAGLIPSRIAPNWDRETSVFVRKLWDVWWKRRSEWEDRTMSSKEWQTAGMRPHNHPIRRMAAAASIARSLPSIEKELARRSATEPEKWCRNACSLIKKTATMKYWRKRLSLEGCVHQSDIALLGDHRVAAILSNVIIPYMLAADVDVTEIVQNLPPEDNNSIIRLMAYTLLTRDHNPALLETGLRQQGLIQIFQNFCLVNTEGCSSCQFAQILNGYTGTTEERGHSSAAR